MKKQVIFIHGGGSFDTQDDYIEFLKKEEFNPYEINEKRWWHSLEEKLGIDFDIMTPTMPNINNASYEEWKTWFEKIFPYLRDNVILIGHSLGGAFLAKYLSENKFPKNILATYLVAASYHDVQHYSKDSFVPPESLQLLEKQGGKITIYHSEDDTRVSFEYFSKFVKALPNAHAVAFQDRGHLTHEEFPELIQNILLLR